MKNKYYLQYIIILLILIIPIKIDALSASSIASRNVCSSSNYEVAYAKNNDTLENIACYSTYQDAYNKMESVTSSEVSTAVILDRSSGTTKLINAKYGIANLHKTSGTTNIYTSSALSSAYTYVNGNQALGGSDAAFISLNYSNKAAQIKLSGYIGWVSSSDYYILPLSWIKSTNKYIVSSTNIKHCYTTNILTTISNPTCNTIGPKPTVLNAGTYYSFDGIYMYNNLLNLLTDLKKSSTSLSVNSSNPYYNYYLYLPHRGRSTYSSTDIDAYIRQYGYTEKIYNGSLASNQSMMYGEGTFIYNAQESYGANAILMFGVGRNESGFGRSAISIDKNNLFGMGAYDSNPYYGASGYLTVSLGIYRYAWDYVSYGYDEPLDWRYFGGHLGNKLSGFNVKYASDAYWGEKAAAHYYAFDNYYGLQDYNYYQLAVKKDNSTTYAYHTASTSATKSYPMSKTNEPIIIVQEVTGETINGSNKWYKITSDQTLYVNGTKILYTTSYMQTYPWANGYAYVHSSYFTKINSTTLKNPINVTKYADSDYKYELFYNSANKVLTPKIGQVLEDTKVYYGASLETVKNNTIKKGAYVTIIEQAKDGNGNIKAYLISYQANRNTREWVGADKVKLTSMTYAKFNSNGKNILNNPNGSSYGTANLNTYVAILDSTIVNGKTWLKVSYDATGNTYGYTLASNVTYDASKIVKDQIPGEAIVSFNGIKHISDSNFEISGSLVIDGIDITSSTNVTYSLVLKNESDTTKTYSINLDRWLTNYPYEIVNSKNNDYSGGWFKGNVSLKDIPKGNYIVYVKIVCGLETREVLFRNLAFKDMDKRINDTTNNRGYEFRTNYYNKEAYLNLFVRDASLINNSVITSYQNMFNTFFTIDFEDNKLNILGNSFNINGLYTKNDNVERKIILENTLTYDRVIYDNIGSIDNGPYAISLNSSTKDLTRAWYKASIDISSLPVGNYAIYVYTNSTVADYGELYDIAFREINYEATINNKVYSIVRKDDFRYRLELVVE